MPHDYDCINLGLNQISYYTMSFKTILTSVLLIVISLIALTTSIVSFKKQTNNKELVEMANKQSLSFSAQIRYSILTDGIVIDDPRFVSAVYECGNNPLFVVRHSFLDCSSCQEDIISMISRHIRIEDNPRVLFIACGYKDKSFSYGRTVYLEDTLGWGGLFDMPNYPFVFIYDNRVLHSYLPDPILGNNFEDYLEAINDHYSINN